jgi:hypothetical protein
MNGFNISSTNTKYGEWSVVSMNESKLQSKTYAAEDNEEDEELLFADVRDYPQDNSAAAASTSYNSFVQNYTINSSPSPTSFYRLTNRSTPTSWGRYTPQSSRNTPTFMSAQNQKSILLWNGNRNLKEEIRLWASSNESTENMMQIYIENKKKWDEFDGSDEKTTEIISLQKTIIIKRLAENHRADVLDNFFDIEGYIKNDNKFNPIQYTVWVNNEGTDLSFNNIVNTINILVTKYKYRILTTNSNIDYETIFGTLNEPKNHLPVELKTSIYEYMTSADKDLWYIADFTSYIQKINSLNDKSKNKLLFMLTNYYTNNEFIIVLLKNLIEFLIDGLERNKNIIHIVETLFGLPNLNDTEMRFYFESINIVEKHINICKIILLNADQYIKQKIQDDLDSNIIEEPELDEENKYTCYFSILGTIYAKNICKNEIMSKVLEYYEKLKQDKSLHYIKPILTFIIHSGIAEQEHEPNDLEKIIVLELINTNTTYMKIKVFKLFKTIFNSNNSNYDDLKIQEYIDKLKA